MKREVARFVHESVNAFAWMENTQWDAGSRIANVTCKAVRALPFSIYDLEKRAFFKIKPLQVSGESVVIQSDPHSVKKYMFRYPSHLSLEEFEDQTRQEITTLTMALGKRALATEVGIASADIFRWPLKSVRAVTQTQPLLDLNENPAFTINSLNSMSPLLQQQVALELKALARDAKELYTQHRIYPDITPSSGNLRINSQTGKLTLIDVMPVHADGSRLIGDRPKNQLAHIEKALTEFENA